MAAPPTPLLILEAMITRETPVMFPDSPRSGNLRCSIAGLATEVLELQIRKIVAAVPAKDEDVPGDRINDPAQGLIDFGTGHCFT